MSQLIEKSLSRRIHFPPLASPQLPLWGRWGLSLRYPDAGATQRSNPPSLPPPDLPLPPSALSSVVLHLKPSSECQRPCGSVLTAAFLCHIRTAPAASHYCSLSFSLSLPRFLVFHSADDLGEIIVWSLLFFKLNVWITAWLESSCLTLHTGKCWFTHPLPSNV